VEHECNGSYYVLFSFSVLQTCAHAKLFPPMLVLLTNIITYCKLFYNLVISLVKTTYGILAVHIGIKMSNNRQQAGRPAPV
jgi:hypothetical protein